MSAIRMWEEIDPSVMEEENDQFQIEDLNQCTWAFKKIAYYQARMAEVKEVADEEIAKIKHWQEQEEQKWQRQVEFFENLIDGYLKRKRIEDPDYNISTPYGKAYTRKQQPKFKYKDDELLNFLKDNGLKKFIRTKESPDKAGLKQSFNVVGNRLIDKETGQVIEGIMIEHRPEKTYIQVEV